MWKLEISQDGAWYFVDSANVRHNMPFQSTSLSTFKLAHRIIYFIFIFFFLTFSEFTFQTFMKDPPPPFPWFGKSNFSLTPMNSEIHYDTKMYTQSCYLMGGLFNYLGRYKIPLYI